MSWETKRLKSFGPQHIEHAVESEYALDIAAFSADYNEQVPVDGYVKMVFKVRASCY